MIGEIKGAIEKIAGDKLAIEKPMKDRIVVGLDISDEFSQVSYLNISEEEPETLSTVLGSDQICIPTVIAKYVGQNTWTYGNEAVEARNKVVAVDRLVEKARSGMAVGIDGRDYDPIDLLTLYIKKCLALLSIAAPLEKVSIIMITAPEMDARMVEILDKAIETLRIKPEKVFYQNHAESTYQYMIHQSKELWNHDVLIMHLTSDGLNAKSMRKNIHTSPVVVLMEERNVRTFTVEDIIDAPEGRKKRKDQELYQLLYGIMEGKFYSAVYLLGDGFDGDWCDESLKYMCRNRRVFRGNNLFSKGACYSAKEKLEPSELSTKYVFLGKDKVKANVGMRVYRDGEEVYMALLDAGKNWYDTSREMDFILDREDSITLTITPLNGKNAHNAQIYLTGLPVRPPRATRIHLELKMVSEKRLHIHVTDLGFGEFYPASGLDWTGELEVE